MINLKALFKIAIVITLVPTASYSQKLKLVWGIENSEYFKESKVDKEGTGAIHTTPKKGAKLYRFVSSSDLYRPILFEFFDRHHKLWDNFIKQNPQIRTNVNNKTDFITFAKKEDPYYLGLTKKLAPQLYFDFTGGNQEYTLESISIQTISFEEYKGGGFSQNEAWYDIILKHIPGIYTYNVDKKLAFNTNGRAVLRFWSDNYYVNMGLTPTGCYTLKITFNFIANGIKESVSTEVFKMDV
jgi:hypothetical protein